MTTTRRRIQLLRERFATPAQGFAYNGLIWNKAWMPDWQELDAAIEAVAERAEVAQ